MANIRDSIRELALHACADNIVNGALNSKLYAGITLNINKLNTITTNKISKLYICNKLYVGKYLSNYQSRKKYVFLFIRFEVSWGFSSPL